MNRKIKIFLKFDIKYNFHVSWNIFTEILIVKMIHESKIFKNIWRKFLLKQKENRKFSSPSSHLLAKREPTRIPGKQPLTGPPRGCTLLS